jgi:hypothetical protein
MLNGIGATGATESSENGKKFNVLNLLCKWSSRLLLCLAVKAIAAPGPALTIYNQNFAVVRDAVPLELKSGSNQVRFAGATAFLEPSSVVLRDPLNRHHFQVLEQNYRGDPVSQQMLLARNEGNMIDFETTTSEGGQLRHQLVRGKIIRADDYDPRTQPYTGHGASQPIIEVNGKLRFDLPGQPIFPGLSDDTILKPMLVWVIDTDQPARFDAELSYVTGEMRWEADYNLVLPERGKDLDLVGWVTIENESGRSFEHARIKLMAGDVNKVQNRPSGYGFASGGGGGSGNPPVSEKSFDEYHLYTLERPTTLHDREKKQVEFVRAAGIQSTVYYVYDGASSDEDQIWAPPQEANTQPDYGTQSNKKVWVMRELTNSETNHLGIPLPKGRVRLYQRDTDGQMEFIGENTIKHTPRDEVIRLFTGSSFDLVGERKRTNLAIHVSSQQYAVDPATGLPVPNPTKPSSHEPPSIDESFEITLRNHKKDMVEIRVVEHLNRWINWEITEKSVDCTKTDAQTIEFRMQLKPDQQQKLTYTVHYSW